MPTYISEYNNYGYADSEFIEVAVPAGTDVSGYSIAHYNGDGELVETWALGTSTATTNGHDVYVIDSGTPGFDTMTGQGELASNSAIALVDDTGTVAQFLSHWGNEITAVDGPANGMTSREIGMAGSGQSYQSDDERYLERPALVPAKALVDLPKIRHKRGAKKVTWYHFACDPHQIVFAEGCATESLLLEPMVLGDLSRQKLRDRATRIGWFGQGFRSSGRSLSIVALELTALAWQIQAPEKYLSSTAFFHPSRNSPLPPLDNPRQHQREWTDGAWHVIIGSLHRKEK